jgi:hypothetical protein
LRRSFAVLPATRTGGGRRSRSGQFWQTALAAPAFAAACFSVSDRLLTLTSRRLFSVDLSEPFELPLSGQLARYSRLRQLRHREKNQRFSYVPPAQRQRNTEVPGKPLRKSPQIAGRSRAFLATGEAATKLKPLRSLRPCTLRRPQYRNGSMAVWCKPVNDKHSATAEVHFNYWRMPSGETENADFAEIGILLTHPESINEICIYVPIEVSDDDLEDCAPYFSNPDIAQGIFNEALTVSKKGAGGPQRVELTLMSGHYCSVHIFPTSNQRLADSQISVEKCESGSLISIRNQAIREICNCLPDNGRAYFRIRIHNAGKSRGFVSTIKPKDNILMSGFTQVEYFDFRLNEARTLPASVETRMRVDAGGNPVPLRRVAFLTAVPVTADLTVSSLKTHKNRPLEHSIWKSYIKSGIPDGMMVYHWKKEDEVNVGDFTSFVKLQTRRSGTKTIITYLAIAFLFGVAGNLVAAAITALGSVVLKKL